jgi:NAD(P)-dependent dehydrogenase (short-subunit alcohol dehydrogenase family)
VVDLTGKIILVTGATSGIGRASALSLAACGAWIGVAGRNETRGAETVLAIEARGGKAEFISLDVTKENDWANALTRIDNTKGALHALVNNAGESILRSIAELDVEDLRFLLGVNYEGCFLGMQHAFPLLRKSGGGSVINVSSVAGIRAGPGGSAYGASKAAMTGLTREAARVGALKRPVIRVNSVHPGLIWGDGVVDSFGEEGAERFKKLIVDKTPLGRVGEPKDIANFLTYLLSDAAAAINGQQIVLDGGLALNYP